MRPGTWNASILRNLSNSHLSVTPVQLIIRDAWYIHITQTMFCIVGDQHIEACSMIISTEEFVRFFNVAVDLVLTAKKKSRVCKSCTSCTSEEMHEVHKKLWHYMHLQVVSMRKKFWWCTTWKLWETAPFLAVSLAWYNSSIALKPGFLFQILARSFGQKSGTESLHDVLWKCHNIVHKTKRFTDSLKTARSVPSSNVLKGLHKLA